MMRFKQQICFCLVLLASLVASLTAHNTSMNVRQVESSPHDLYFTWDLPQGMEIQDEFEVKAQKRGSRSWIIAYGDSTATSFHLADLMTNAHYTVCMSVTLTPVNNTEPASEAVNQRECAVMRTPPTIRADSVLVLLAVIGYLLAMVLLGYICWSRAHRQQRPDDVDDEDTEIVEKIENGESRPFLLNAQPPGLQAPRPRSAIEDEDIPYITPTWDQLASEK